MRKRIIALIILVVSLFSFPGSISYATGKGQAIITQAQGEALLDQLLERQFEARTMGVIVDTSDIFAESPSTSHFNMYLDWCITGDVLLDTVWKDYTYDLYIKKATRNGNDLDIAAIVSTDYTLAKNGLECGQHDYAYNVTVTNTLDGLRISKITTEEGIYSEFCMNILAVEKLSEARSRAEEIFIAAIEDLEALAEEMENFEYRVAIPDNKVTPPDPTRGTFTYNPTIGINYANKYHTSYNTCFKSITEDCTNFVSQCIWAAYGGWSSGDSTQTMANNIIDGITNGRRMNKNTNITKWFGHSNGHGNAWESVENLWNFTTSNPSEGPKATGYNNNALYTGIAPGSIFLGNVIQFWSSSLGRYRHSMYVVERGSAPYTYADVVVASHSSNGRYSLATKIAGWGGTSCKMRRLSFNSANFLK